MPRLLYARGKMPRYPLDSRLGGSRYAVILVTVADNGDFIEERKCGFNSHSTLVSEIKASFIMHWS
jgi:hypothetical protein